MRNYYWITGGTYTCMHVQKGILMIVLVLILMVPAIMAESPSTTHSDIRIVEQADTIPGLFEIRIVDPELLNTVRNNYGSQAIPLKVEKGLYIGVLTPNVLYLRGDLNESEFPVQDIIHKNLEDRIEKHLIDITFGRDNVKTDLFGKDHDYKVWLKAMYYQSDIDTIRDFITVFNDMSQTTMFEDEEIALPSYKPNYNPDPYTYYTISFVDKDLFFEKYDDRSSEQYQVLHDPSGKPVVLVRKDGAYIQQDLKGNERSHFLLRSLLFSMGFHGESTDKDSFFNPSNTGQTTLSPLDKDAIQLMYGGRLQSGLTLEDVKKALGMADKK